MDLTFVDRALGSNIPYITYAVPFFFLLMGVELAVAVWQREHSYRLHDSINDLSCGITEQVVGIFLKGLLFTGYLKTYGFATSLVSIGSTFSRTRTEASGLRRLCFSSESIALLLVPSDRP